MEAHHLKQFTSQSPQETVGEKPLAHRKLLLVDDSSDNRLLGSVLLSRLGAQVETATGGLDALSKVNLKDYDGILLDIQMPDLDGYSVLKELRDRGYDKPVIAVTAHVTLQDQITCLNAGFAAHIGKPINKEKLISTLRDAIP